MCNCDIDKLAASLTGRDLQEEGLTKREQFCLAMGVPETGSEYLDRIIRKGNQQKAAMIAMQGILSAGYHKDIEAAALRLSDALLSELNKPKN